ncbi:MAG: 2-isopropylmalate synthase [Alphaproteobacteria bacterium]|nr:2-isopropylmalate synthase [Alphaproteobacteria bacterium]
MPAKFLRVMLAGAALMFCIDSAWAQRNSTFEERLEYGWDSARSQELNYTKTATPQQCRDLCLANGQCRYWNWTEPGGRDKSPSSIAAHTNCVLLKTTTGPTRGRDYGYPYAGGAITESSATRPPEGTQRPVQSESAQRHNAPPPAPSAQGGCRHDIKTWSDGTRMEGTMCNGKLHGRGTYSDPTGQRYEGEWRNGVIAGQGFAHFPNGATYDGQWDSGKPHGYGTYSNANGVFAGNWNNGCAVISGQRLWVATERHECGF